MKKIVHVTEAWAGGIATYVEGLIADQLKRDKMYEIHLLYATNKVSANFEQIFPYRDRVSLYGYESCRSPLKFISISRKIDDVLQHISPDIVHLHSTFPGVYGRLRKRFPTIYCAHCWAFCQDVSTLRKRLFAFIERCLTPKADAIINISWDEYQKAKDFGINHINNTVIYNGVSPANKAIGDAPLEIDKSCLNIGFIGRLDHQKGYDLIEPYFRNQTKGLKLYVIGEAELDSHRSFRSTKNIHYLGWVDNKKIDGYIEQFDVLIVPSRYEGFGLVTIEAMRNRKPVIVSNQGALPELVIHGYNGYVFDLNDVHNQLEILFENITKSTLKPLGQNAYDVYQRNFKSELCFEKIHQLYQQVLSKNTVI